MAQQDLLTSLAHTLCSYPLSDNIVVLSGVTQKDVLLVAHACAMVPGIGLILVDDREDRLAEAKASLVSRNPAVKNAVHTFAAENMDQDRVASIFATIRSEFGDPKGLILGNGSRPCRRRLLEYSASRSILNFTAEDMMTFLDFNDHHKKGLTRSFLAHGSNGDKTIINISSVVDMFSAPLVSENERALGLLVAHVKRNDDYWKFTAQGLPGNCTATQLFKSTSVEHNWTLNSGRSGLLRSPSYNNYLTST